MCIETETVATEHYPADLDSWIDLPDGKRLRVRPLRRDDEGTIRDLYAQLSDRTRYQRFLFVAREIPEPLLRILLGVDYRRRLGLVVEDDEAGGAAIGLGSFGAIDGGSAELGLVVRDDWQRKRVGTELAARVMQAAEDRGFHRFIAHVLQDNAGIRRIVEASSKIVSAHSDGGVTELVFIRRTPLGH